MFHLAEPYLRPPNNQPHPDLFRIRGSDDTILRGEIVEHRVNTTRVPDIESQMWFGTERLRKYWRRNWDATGDSERTPDQGPAPEGWTSRQRRPPVAVPAPAAGGAWCHDDGVSRFATWTRVDYAARNLITTLDPLTLRDGGPDLGPRWSKIIRRVTYDLYDGTVLHACRTKGLSPDDATGPIPGCEPGEGRDVRTVFYFRKGAWGPRCLLYTSPSPRD